MFTPTYEVHFQAMACESENIVTGCLHFAELSGVTEFVDLASDYYDFETVEVYRVYKNDLKNGGFCSCRAENI